MTNNKYSSRGRAATPAATGGKGWQIARWMTNCLIYQETGRCCFLDLDPGQKEFLGPFQATSPRPLDKPLLGPNFVTSKLSGRSRLLGDINISNNPGRYISCVSELLTISDEFSGPMAVNTMGWCQGLGASSTRTSSGSVNQLPLSSYSRFPKKNQDLYPPTM